MSDDLEVTATGRGFAIVEFTDLYDQSCSLQKSSLASRDCIWFGVDDAAPKIMARDAERMGLPTGGQRNGWVPFAVPSEVQLSTRMHLTRDQVRALIPLLNHFVNTGELPDAGTVIRRQGAKE